MNKLQLIGQDLEQIISRNYLVNLVAILGKLGQLRAMKCNFLNNEMAWLKKD
jgi:hypothetical protein